MLFSRSVQIKITISVSFCNQLLLHPKYSIYLCLLFFSFQSSYPMRMNRCNQILKKAVSLKQSLEKFIGDANRLTDKLLELCNKPVYTPMHKYTSIVYDFSILKSSLGRSRDISICVLQVNGNSTTLSMSIHFKQLKRLVEEPTFSQILIPLQSVLIPTLPSTGGENTQHDAFPGHWAYLDGFEDSVRERGC